jgi:hypothetical protein
LFYVLALELIANESSRTQTERPADRRANAGPTHGSADNTAGSRAAERAYSGAFFSGA